MTEIFRAGHPGGPARPARGRIRAGHDRAADDAPDRPAPGRAHRHARHRQRVHRDDQGPRARLGRRASRSSCGAPSRSAGPTSGSFETLLFAAAVYWVLTIIFSLFQERLEKRMARERPANLTTIDVRRPVRRAGRPDAAGAHRSCASSASTSTSAPTTCCAAGRWRSTRARPCASSAIGSGKSTLLRCINFLEEPTMGAIEVDGSRSTADPLPPAAAPTASRSARSGCGPRWCSRSSTCSRTYGHRQPDRGAGPGQGHAARRGDRDRRAVPRQGRPARQARRVPGRLSGGQKQRVAIARALTMEPKVLLFDEPTSALDPTLVGEVLNVMEELAHEGATMIVVTHEMAFAREAADRVYFIEDGEFIEVGPPEQVIDDPQDQRTRDFLARTLGEAHVHEGGDGPHAGAVVGPPPPRIRAPRTRTRTTADGRSLPAGPRVSSGHARPVPSRRRARRLPRAPRPDRRGAGAPRGPAQPHPRPVREARRARHRRRSRRRPRRSSSRTSSATTSRARRCRVEAVLRNAPRPTAATSSCPAILGGE